MSTPTCMYPGCTNVATHRCSKCPKVFCLQHIAYYSVDLLNGWFCAETLQEMIKARTKTRDTWTFILIFSLAYTFLAIITMSQNFNGFFAYMTIPSGILAFIGLCVVPGQIAWVSNLKSFYKKNYSIPQNR